MKRRALLAGVGAVVAGGGVAQVLGDDDAPYELHVTAATGQETDRRCHLDPETVAEHPVLEDALQAATDLPAGERVTRPLSTEQATAIRYVITHCEGESNALYEYRGEWAYVSIFIDDVQLVRHHHGSHNHSNGTTTTT